MSAAFSFRISKRPVLDGIGPVGMLGRAAEAADLDGVKDAGREAGEPDLLRVTKDRFHPIGAAVGLGSALDVRNRAVPLDVRKSSAFSVEIGLCPSMCGKAPLFRPRHKDLCGYAAALHLICE